MTAVVVAGELLPAAGSDLAQVVPDDLGEHVKRWLGAVTGPTPSEHTLRAYIADTRAWFEWCQRRGVDPRRVAKADVDLYSKQVSLTPSPRTGRLLAPASVARRIATVASLYTYLLDMDVVDQMPVRRRARPKVSADSTTRGLSRGEALAVLARADVEADTDRAVINMLAGQGLRVSELCDLDVGSITYQDGVRVLIVYGKGGKRRTLTLSRPVLDAVDAMLTGRARAAGLDSADQLEKALPLFVRTIGQLACRFDQRSIARLVRRIARAAGIKEPNTVTPHSLRHTFATLMRDAGVSLDVVRDLMGHSSVTTTERYERTRGGARGAVAVHKLATYLTPEGT